MADLPVRFEERMKALLGEEYPAFAASYDKERVQGLRFNSLKFPDRIRIQDAVGSRENREAGKNGEAKAVCEAKVTWEEAGAAEAAKQIGQETGFTLERIPWVKEGYYYSGSSRPGKHPYHEAGLYYIQEPSAMAVVELLDPRPGERVLDLCAAPGGKSSHIASRMKGSGFLLSNEIHPARARILSQNMERMGVRNAVVSNEDARSLAGTFDHFFHKIVVDAPCSGEGMFRKDEEARSQWSEEHVKMCAARQGEILDHAASMLAPGGRMVYSTCTFAPEENEGTVLAPETPSGILHGTGACLFWFYERKASVGRAGGGRLGPGADLSHYAPHPGGRGPFHGCLKKRRRAGNCGKSRKPGPAVSGWQKEKRSVQGL